MNSSFEEYLSELGEKFADVPQFYADSANFRGVVFLDAREIEEYATSKIASATWIGTDDFELSRIDSIDRNTKIVVYCSVGYRSSVIVREMRQAGFRNSYNLYGGIFKWANDGRPLHKDGVITNRIHGYNRKWSRYIRNPFLDIVY